MDPLLPIATTADWFPASVDVTIVFSTAGFGATFGTVVGVGMGLTNDQIGTWTARGTAAGLLLGLLAFGLALLLLPRSDAALSQIAAIFGLLGLSRGATWWIVPGFMLTVVGVLIVDSGQDAWIAYLWAGAGATLTVLGWGWSDWRHTEDSLPSEE